MPARSDADAAPHADLLNMRRGTAHFARVLNNLSDPDIAGCDQCRRLVAEISIQARRLAIQTKSLYTALSDEESEFEMDVAHTATLPIHALRHLFTHSALHLNVELRDLEDVHWPAANHIPRQRADAIWHAAEVLKGHCQMKPI